MAIFNSDVSLPEDNSLLNKQCFFNLNYHNLGLGGPPSFLAHTCTHKWTWARNKLVTICNYPCQHAHKTAHASLWMKLEASLVGFLFSLKARSGSKPWRHGLHSKIVGENQRSRPISKSQSSHCPRWTLWKKIGRDGHLSFPPKISENDLQMDFSLDLYEHLRGSGG
jgi:hypothetical protein